jgi:antitoxin (DNA-binding transcriptional repressor) of toxin-antitoxin stability system
MKQIQASEAKAKFSELLDEVERGDTIVITRHGKPIARLVREGALRQQEVELAIAEIEAARKHMPRVTKDEIIAWRNEGRK